MKSIFKATIARGLYCSGLVGVTPVAVTFGVESHGNAINAEINLMRSESEQYVEANLDREALIESLKAGDRLKNTSKFWVKPNTRTQTVTTLHQAIYGVKEIEFKTLKGHSSEVYSLSFSPDGKTIASASTDNTIKLWNFDLDKLMLEGCDLLHNYLINNPQRLR